MDFVGQQSLDSLEAPKVKLSRKDSAGSSSEAGASSMMGGQQAGGAVEDEDEELMRAIQMSMQQVRELLAYLLGSKQLPPPHRLACLWSFVLW